MSTATRERSIVFSGPMVKATIEGRKTVTRRVVKPQPGSPAVLAPDYMWIRGKPTCIWPADYANEDGIHLDLFAMCPYGRPGDRLWVKEKHSLYKGSGIPSDFVNATYCCFPDGDQTYKSGGWHHWGKPVTGTWPKGHRWRSPRFMPRWASRITLEVTGVRVERVQAIGAADALAEGVGDTPFWAPKELEGRPFEEKWWDDFHFWQHYPRIVFERLWDSINGKRPGSSWDANPWVWVVSFRRLP